MKEKTTQRERLYEFIKFLGLSVRAFEQSIGVGNGTVNSIRENASKNIINRTCERYPELDPMWLQTGIGTMIRKSYLTQGDGSAQDITNSSVQIGISPKNFTNEKEWFDLVREKDSQINRLLTIIENMQR